MNPVKRSLVAIAACIARAVGAVIHFVANGDISKTKPRGAMGVGPAQSASANCPLPLENPTVLHTPSEGCRT